MKRVRIGIIGAGGATEWAILPVLSGPDAVSPPDSGAWWGRRPLPDSAISYQAPARPEVVAIADRDGARAGRLAESWRVRASYSDWRLMLREVELDALLCLAPPEVAAEVVVAAGAAVRHLWLDGPPALSAAATRSLEDRLQGRALKVWCGHSLRAAAAHRAAQRLIERGQIGEVSALSLRWPAPLHHAPPQAGHDAPYFTSSYAALDLLLHFANAGRGKSQITAAQNGGATSLLLRFDNGASATALFAGAENWSAPLPRLEICGTQGRSVVCEGGRRLWLHEPRESARLLEPPGLAAHVSAANITGVAEDLKAFLGSVVEAGESDETSPLSGAAIALEILEAAGRAVNSGESVETGASENKLQKEAYFSPPNAPPKPLAPAADTLKLPL